MDHHSRPSSKKVGDESAKNHYTVLQDLMENDSVIEEKAPQTVVKRVADGSLGVSKPNDGLEDESKTSESDDGREDVSKISDASVGVKGIQKSRHPSGNGNNQESHVITEGSTVHVRNLPPDDTFAKVVSAFKTFGAIKQIHVKNPGSDYYYAFVEFKDANAAERAIKASPVMIDGRQVHVDKKREIKADAGDETGNGNNHENQGVTEGAGIYVKNLPPDATIALVQKTFEQFGAIRRDGIEVRNRWGYSYGFIDFEEEKAARMAIEASPVIVLEQRVHVEKKRSAYRSWWSSPSSGQAKEMRVYGFRDWQKSKEEQSKRQEEEGGRGFDWDSEQVMEEHCKFQEEKMKFQEEKMKLQEETIKFQEEKMKLQEEKMKKLQEEKTKLQEEKMKKLHAEKTRFREEKTRLQEEKTRLQEEQRKLQEEQRKLKEEEENQN